MSYKTPLSTTTGFGGVKAGSGIDINDGVISTGGLSNLSYYGKFFSSTTQNNSAANAVNIISFPITVLTSDITTSGTSITFAKAGVYTISYEVQAATTSGGGGNIDIWISSNSVNMPNSNSITTLEGGGDSLIINRSFLLSITANEVIQVKWSSPVSSMQLVATGTKTGPVRPATNSANFLATLVKAS